MSEEPVNGKWVIELPCGPGIAASAVAACRVAARTLGEQGVPEGAQVLWRLADAIANAAFVPPGGRRSFVPALRPCCYTEPDVPHREGCPEGARHDHPREEPCGQACPGRHSPPGSDGGWTA